MTLVDLYKNLINKVVEKLKEIDELNVNNVFVWKLQKSPKVSTIEAFVLGGEMRPVGGYTSKSSVNELHIMVDLIYYGMKEHDNFLSCMGVAEKIYDKFHRTNMDGLVTNNTSVSINPGEGQFASKSLLATPIQIDIAIETVVTQR